MGVYILIFCYRGVKEFKGVEWDWLYLYFFLIKSKSEGVDFVRKVKKISAKMIKKWDRNSKEKS